MAVMNRQLRGAHAGAGVKTWRLAARDFNAGPGGPVSLTKKILTP